MMSSLAYTNRRPNELEKEFWILNQRKVISCAAHFSKFPLFYFWKKNHNVILAETRCENNTESKAGTTWCLEVLVTRTARLLIIVVIMVIIVGKADEHRSLHEVFQHLRNRIIFKLFIVPSKSLVAIRSERSDWRKAVPAQGSNNEQLETKFCCNEIDTLRQMTFDCSIHVRSTQIFPLFLPLETRYTVNQ